MLISIKLSNRRSGLFPFSLKPVSQGKMKRGHGYCRTGNQRQNWTRDIMQGMTASFSTFHGGHVSVERVSQMVPSEQAFHLCSGAVYDANMK